MEANKEKEKNILVKAKAFFSHRKTDIALFILLVVACKLTGIPFGYLLGLAIFIWASNRVKKGLKYGPFLSGALNFAVFCVLIYAIIVPNMPRTVEQSDVTRDRFDQWAASLMGDRTETVFKDLWKVRKDQKGQVLVAYCDFLLKDNRPQEARDTLIKFMKAWDLDQIKENPKPVNSNGVSSSQSQSSLQPQIQLQSKASPVEPKIYKDLGTYIVASKKNEESDWITVADCRHYNFTHLNFEIVYKDGSSKNVWEVSSLPSIVTFKVINRSNEPVGLIVKA